MNKPKSQRLDLTTMTGEQIADLILNGKYTKSALCGPSLVETAGQTLYMPDFLRLPSACIF
ncbi:TPA: hypothetical protein ACIC40_001797 [Escherichia coli]